MFLNQTLELVSSFVMPKEPKAFVIRKTRQIPFIDQLIAETLLF